MKEICEVCERRNEGFFLYNMFICFDCEREIVSTPPESPVYKVFVKKLKAIYERKIEA